MALLAYSTAEDQAVANDAWAYLRDTFPGAEITIESIRHPEARRQDWVTITVFSPDPRDDERCQDERPKLLDFLNTRYATHGLPPIPPHHIECYPLP